MDNYDTDSSSEEELLPQPTFDVPTIQNNEEQQNVNDNGFRDLGDLSASINAPADRYNIIYIIFIIQGIGMLLPWNFFITAKTYFEYKFKNDPDLMNKFENAFALAAMFPNLMSTFLNVFLVKVSRGGKIITCLMTMFSLFVLTSVFARINTQAYVDIFFAITVACVVVINFAGGIYQGTLFGVAGIIGMRYTQALMSGQSIAGIFAAVADLITKLANPSGNKDPTLSGFMYFLTATIVIIITAVSYTVLMKMPRMQFYFRRFERHSKKDQKARKVDINQPKIPYLLILKEIKWKAFSVVLVFLVTLTLFPAILSKIESNDKNNGSRVTNDLFPSLVCFLLFNVGDWCGRQLAGQLQCGLDKGPWLPILSILRIGFIPLFLMCNVSGNRYLPNLLKSDVWPIILNVFFSVSNGYLGSICMMTAPKLVKLEYAEIAGTMMGLFLTLGLTLGAVTSFAF